MDTRRAVEAQECRVMGKHTCSHDCNTRKLPDQRGISHQPVPSKKDIRGNSPNISEPRERVEPVNKAQDGSGEGFPLTPCIISLTALYFTVRVLLN